MKNKCLNQWCDRRFLEDIFGNRWTAMNLKWFLLEVWFINMCWKSSKVNGNLLFLIGKPNHDTRVQTWLSPFQEQMLLNGNEWSDNQSIISGRNNDNVIWLGMCGIKEDSKYPSFTEVKSLEGIGAWGAREEWTSQVWVHCVHQNTSSHWVALQISLLREREDNFQGS